MIGSPCSRVKPLPAGRTNSASLTYSFRLLHPAAIPRTPPFIAVRQRVDNSVTCPDGSSWSLIIRHKHLRNVEVRSSGPAHLRRCFPDQRELTVGSHGRGPSSSSREYATQFA